MDNEQSEVSPANQDDIKRKGMTITEFLSVHGIKETPVDLDDSDKDRKGAATASSILVDKDGQKYSVGNMVAQGGMGTILSAKDLNISRTVAMKVMLDPKSASQDSILRFIEEAKVTGQLEHPGIVPIYELSVDESENVFYTMKFVKGMNLNDILRGIREGNRETIEKYPLNRLLNIFLKTCDAMSFSHHKGVIHRDLKPENIMVGDYGEVLVMDWGLSKVVKKNITSADNSKEDKIPDEIINSLRADEVGSAMMTMEGAVLGTPAFMPPEQAKGQLENLDARSDIYSLGAILYNILTLHPPVEADNINQLLIKVVKGEIRTPAFYNTSSVSSADDPLEKQVTDEAVKSCRLPHCPGNKIPVALTSVTMKALALRQEDRYQTVEALQKDIEAFQGGFATAAEEAGLLTQMMLLVKRHKGVFGSIATALLIVILIVSLAFVRINAEKKKAEANEKTAIEARELANKNEEKANAALNNLKTVSTQAAPEFLNKARKFMAMSDWANAEKNVDITLGLNPDLGPAWYLKGQLSLCKLDWDNAINAFSKSEGKYKKKLINLAEKYRSLSKSHDGKLLTRELQRLSSELTELDEFSLASVVAEKIKGSMSREDEKKRLLKLVELKIEAAKKELIKLNPEQKKLKFDYSFIHNKPFLIISGNLKLTDISPLKGLPFFRLGASSTSISDISVLKGMPLTILDIRRTPIKDISPLKDLKLTNLQMSNTRVKDISALKGLPLISLDISKTPIKNISALKGMPLTRLVFNFTKISYISALKGMPLEHLDAFRTQVKDISVLKGMPLTFLKLDCTKVSDISALKGMPLKQLSFSGTPVSDISALEGMPLERLSISCKKINDISALKGMPLTLLSFPRTQVEDISMLKGMPLKTLVFGDTQVGDISVLKGMSLKFLDMTNCPVKNISALKGMPLEKLTLNGCREIKDISPLKGMPLKYLDITYLKNIESLDSLAGMPLEELNINASGVKDIIVLKNMPLKKLIASNLRELVDISALKGMPLVSMSLFDTGIKDISVLKGMPLKELNLGKCKQLNDLSPLAGCLKLEKLIIPGHCLNIEFLKNLPKLKIICFDASSFIHARTSVADFWKRWDAVKGK